MPNIEIYGFKPDIVTNKVMVIFGLLENKPYRDECVVTSIDSTVIDHQNRKQPFLRLVTTDNEYLEDIVIELQKMNIDIEVMILQRFIPKKYLKTR